ncbi:UvrD-helicase domain-containing protein [Sphaerisporangium aureirubrum]|uniref:DNA 3'-5' helicase n=1 Tax=Sphaerisporangium aureirubrum TaxID=1544736 RepID=A0ABW1ND58_9ACTN
MPRLGLTREALQHYSKLDKSTQKSINDAIAAFTIGGHGRLEMVPRARDPRIRLFRFSGGTYGVLLASGDGLHLLLAILTHDEAVRFAVTMRASVNLVTGVLELRHETGLEHFRAALHREAEATDARLFGHVGEDQLAELGIDPEITELVRLIVTRDHLIALQRLIPELQFEALLALASGTSYAQAHAEVKAYQVEQMGAPVDPADLATAMRRSPSDVVLVDDADDWREILAHPIDAWRIFLHPAQRSLAYRDRYTGPVLVTGGPGTGKTVTLLHRAHYLAKRWAGRSGTPVLVTTFSRSLARALRSQLRLLIRDDEVLDRIRVSTVDALAYEIVKRAHGREPAIIDDRTLLSRFSDAAKAVHAPFTARFLQEEWLRVILPQRISSLPQYLGCDRPGRGRSLSRGQRHLVWAAVERVTAGLTTRGEWVLPQLCELAAEELAKGEAFAYRNVLVDEAQDLHPAHWRLLRAVVASGPDDLFLVGDPHQRIYDHRVSLASLGVSVRGRSHKLKISYRTTQQILTWATPKLGGHLAAGLDGGSDDLAGFHSPTNGRRPVVRAFADQDQELAALVDQIRSWQAEGVELAAIGVASRSNELIRAARRALHTGGIEWVDLESDVSSDALRTGTMHGMKGREFRCVAVIGVRAGVVPMRAAITPQEEDPKVHERDTQRERCLLFVASTRARDVLYISYHGTPSSFLEEG